MFKADFASNPGKMVNKLVQLYAIGNAAIRYLEWVAGEGFKDGKSR